MPSASSTTAPTQRVPRDQYGVGIEHTLASLTTTRLVLNAVLAMPCPEGHAPPHAYCYEGTRGLCRVRYNHGRAQVTGDPAPAPVATPPTDPEPATTAPLAAKTSKPRSGPRELDFRHPNRQWGGRL